MCKKLLVFLLFASMVTQAAEKVDVLTLGTSLDLSRGGSIAGRSIQDGINAIFDKADIPGIQLKIDFRNDEYSPEKALGNVQSFINDKIDILFMPTGSATFEKYAGLIKEENLPTLFPAPGAARIHDSTMSSCIYLRPSYKDQAVVLARYIVEEVKPKPTKIILFYQDDAFGQACLQGAKKVFDDEHITIIELPHERNNMNLSAQVAKIKQSDADMLGIFSTAITAKGLLEALGDSVLNRLKLFGVDDVGQHPMRQFIEQRGIKIITSNSVPNPDKSEIDLVKEYREKVAVTDIYSLEGYLGASILVDILSKMQKPITKEKIINACEALQNYTLKGFPLSFNKEKRQLINNIWINSGKDEWEKREIPN